MHCNGNNQHINLLSGRHVHLQNTEVLSCTQRELHEIGFLHIHHQTMIQTGLCCRNHRDQTDHNHRQICDLRRTHRTDRSHRSLRAHTTITNISLSIYKASQFNRIQEHNCLHKNKQSFPINSVSSNIRY